MPAFYLIAALVGGYMLLRSAPAPAAAAPTSTINGATTVPLGQKTPADWYDSEVLTETVKQAGGLLGNLFGGGAFGGGTYDWGPEPDPGVSSEVSSFYSDLW